MSLTLLQEFTRRTGIRDGKVDAILIGQAALPKFWNGIELPRSNARDWMMTTIAPPQPPPDPYVVMRRFLPHRIGYRDIKPSDDEIRRMIDELIEGHHTGDMPHEC